MDICTIYKVLRVVCNPHAHSLQRQVTLAGHNGNEFRSAKILTFAQKETLYFQVWSTSSLPNNGLNGKRSGKQWILWRYSAGRGGQRTLLQKVTVSRILVKNARVVDGFHGFVPYDSYFFIVALNIDTKFFIIYH